MARRGTLLRDRPRPTENGSGSSSSSVRRIGGIEIKTASDAAEACFAIFARYGVGKTYLASTILKWESIKIPKMLVINLEGGLRTVRSLGKAIESVDVTTWDEFLKVRGDLETGRASEYGAISLDNGTELADLAMDVTLEKQGKEEPDWLSWRDNSRMYITQAVRPLRNIGRKYGIPIVFTFWDREETSESGAVRAIHADLNPALRRLVLGAVDLACWEEVLSDDKGRALHLAAGRRTDSKFRLDMNLESDMSIPPHMFNPSLATILDTIVDGKPWPRGAHEFPEGLTPRFARQQAQVDAVAQAREERRKAREERLTRKSK